ncbi:hypothetical protein AAHB59_03275 [Bacillus cereus]
MKIVKGLHLLTTKEMLYVANVSEDDVIDPSENKYVQMVKEFAANENSQVIVVCAKIESEIAELDEEEKKYSLKN